MTFTQLREEMEWDWIEADGKRKSDPLACSRKSVVCRISSTDGYETFARATNGPTVNHLCSGVTGGCGCRHAEPAAILKFLRQLLARPNPFRQEPIILQTTWTPCTVCANLIIEFGEQFRNLVKISGIVSLAMTAHDEEGWKRLQGVGRLVILTEEFAKDRDREEITTEAYFGEGAC